MPGDHPLLEAEDRPVVDTLHKGCDAVRAGGDQANNGTTRRARSRVNVTRTGPEGDRRRLRHPATRFVYAQQALFEALTNLPNPALDPTHHLHGIAAEVGDEIAKLGRIVNDGIDGDFRVAVTCFCEDGDLLSQWRGYPRSRDAHDNRSTHRPVPGNHSLEGSLQSRTRNSHDGPA